MKKQPMILVVDDDEELLNLVCRVLELEGFRVAAAHDGYAAMSFLEHGAPDLILLDIMMPGRDGFETLDLIRRKGVDVPVIMLTARCEEYTLDNALREGADDYIRKPFSTVVLLARIQAKLRRAGILPPHPDDTPTERRCQ